MSRARPGDAGSPSAFRCVPLSTLKVRPEARPDGGPVSKSGTRLSQSDFGSQPAQNLPRLPPVSTVYTRNGYSKRGGMPDSPIMAPQYGSVEIR